MRVPFLIMVLLSRSPMASCYIDFFMDIDLSGCENSLEGKELDQKDTDKNIRIVHESRDHFIDFDD